MGKMTEKKDNYGRSVGRRLLSCMLAFCLFVSAFYGIVFFEHTSTPQVAQAAEGDLSIKIRGQVYEDGAEIEMKSAYMVVSLSDQSASQYSSADYNVDWNLLLGDGTVAELYNKTRTTVNVKANQYGEATLQVIVVRTTGELYDHAEFQINVGFGIDTTSSKYQEINGETSLVLNLGTTEQAKLGLGGSATWTSDDEDVFTVDQDGMVKAIGVGYATLTARSGTAGQEPDSVLVYVAPGLSDKDGGPYTRNPSPISISSGGRIYTNAQFATYNQGFDDKIFFEITDMQGTVIVDTDHPVNTKYNFSVSHNENGIYDNGMTIKGISGQYMLYLYTSRTYTDYDDAISPKRAFINFTIESGIEDKDEILGIYDEYVLYESFNLTEKDFNSFFSSTNIYMDNGEKDAKEYNITVPADVATLNGLVLKAGKNEGKIVAVMEVTKDADDRARLQKLVDKNKYPKLPDYFVVKFSIRNAISFSTDYITLYLGDEMDLSITNKIKNYDSVKWSSSDQAKVEVKDVNSLKNKISAKGLADYPGVTVTATVDIGGGVYRVATCYVTVIDTLGDFTLDHTEKQILSLTEEPNSLMVIAKPVNDIGDVESLPLIWTQSNDDVVEIEIQQTKPLNSVAIITPKKGGNTTLMVTDVNSGNVKRLEIEVVIPIDSLTFTESSYTFPMHNSGKLMAPLLEIKPDNATSKEIIWTSSKTSVATIDDNGYLTFVNPGTTTVKAKPKHDKKGVDVATCEVRIAGGPEEIIFENLKDDHLDLEVSEQKVVNVKFVPETAETNLKWTTNVSGLVLVEFDADRKQLTVTGRKSGHCTVTCRTDDNAYYSFTVTIKQGTKSIEFDKESVTLYRGMENKDSTDLSKLLKRTPPDSEDEVKYTSRDEKIAKVDPKTGVVTAVAAGQTYVMASTASGRTNSIDIKVIDQVTGITTDSKKATVYIGETITISPTIVPSTASVKTIKWSWEPYDDGGSASISIVEKGTDVDVTGEAEGLVVLNGVSSGNSSVSITYILNVVYKNPNYDTEVVLSPATKYLNVGKYFMVKRQVKGAYKDNKKLKWKSTNKRIATVTDKGRVKAKKVGKTTIVAIAQDGSKAKGRMLVVVRNQVKKISLNKTTANLFVGKSTKLRVIYTPRNATVKGVTWKSSDPAIATVNGGKVIAVATGIVKITATSKDSTGKKASCWVTVSEPQPITNFTINDAQITVAKGKSVNCGITPNPINATDSIKYFSDNPSVASVNSRGKITTHRVGQASIYARASNGVEGRVDVTVVDLNRKAVTLRQYDTEQLLVNQISQGVTWYSADPNIAKVDESGLVTGRMPGTTIIYANVDGVKLGCRVTVTKIT